MDSSMDCVFLQPQGSKLPQKPVSKTKEGDSFPKINNVPQSTNQTFMIDTSGVLGQTRAS